jgi:hypothetical protein
MVILSNNGLKATISEKEYKNIQKNMVKAYMIDYKVEATNQEIEFCFLLKK